VFFSSSNYAERTTRALAALERKNGILEIPCSLTSAQSVALLSAKIVLKLFGRALLAHELGAAALHSFPFVTLL
jgi:hypothetical protein